MLREESGQCGMEQDERPAPTASMTPWRRFFAAAGCYIWLLLVLLMFVPMSLRASAIIILPVLVVPPVVIAAVVCVYLLRRRPLPLLLVLSLAAMTVWTVFSPAFYFTLGTAELALPNDFSAPVAAGCAVFTLVVVTAVFVPRLRWYMLLLLLAAEAALMGWSRAQENAELRLAESFLRDVRSLVVYDGFFASGKQDAYHQIWRGEPEQAPPFRQYTFDEVRTVATGREVTGEDLRRLTDNLAFRVELFEPWKGHTAAVAVLADGTEHRVCIANYGSFFAMDSLRVIFFLEPGRRHDEDLLYPDPNQGQPPASARRK